MFPPAVIINNLIQFRPKDPFKSEKKKIPFSLLDIYVDDNSKCVFKVVVQYVCCHLLVIFRTIHCFLLLYIYIYIYKIFVGSTDY